MKNCFSFLFRNNFLGCLARLRNGEREKNKTFDINGHFQYHFSNIWYTLCQLFRGSPFFVSKKICLNFLLLLGITDGVVFFSKFIFLWTKPFLMWIFTSLLGKASWRKIVPMLVYTVTFSTTVSSYINTFHYC